MVAPVWTRTVVGESAVMAVRWRLVSTSRTRAFSGVRSATVSGAQVCREPEARRRQPLACAQSARSGTSSGVRGAQVHSWSVRISPDQFWKTRW